MCVCMCRCRGMTLVYDTRIAGWSRSGRRAAITTTLKVQTLATLAAVLTVHRLLHGIPFFFAKVCSWEKLAHMHQSGAAQTAKTICQILSVRTLI